MNEETLFNDISINMAAYSALEVILGVNKYKTIYTLSMTIDELIRFEYEVSNYEGSEEIFLVN